MPLESLNSPLQLYCAWPLTRLPTRPRSVALNDFAFCRAVDSTWRMTPYPPSGRAAYRGGNGALTSRDRNWLKPCVCVYDSASVVVFCNWRSTPKLHCTDCGICTPGASLTMLAGTVAPV